jgi:hypothetical protein
MTNKLKTSDWLKIGNLAVNRRTDIALAKRKRTNNDLQNITQKTKD